MAVMVNADEIAKWPTLSRTALIDRLAAVTAELFGSYQELAMMEAETERGRAQAFAQSEAESVTARREEARLLATPNTIAVLEAKRAVEALECAQNFAYFLLSLGGE